VIIQEVVLQVMLDTGLILQVLDLIQILHQDILEVAEPINGLLYGHKKKESEKLW
jgi:hypothetical protein